jgi:hypothetical protein
MTSWLPQVRLARILYSVQSWQITIVFLTLLLSMLLLLLIKANSCWTYIFMWWVPRCARCPYFASVLSSVGPVMRGITAWLLLPSS